MIFMLFLGVAAMMLIAAFMFLHISEKQRLRQKMMDQFTLALPKDASSQDGSVWQRSFAEEMHLKVSIYLGFEPGTQHKLLALLLLALLVALTQLLLDGPMAVLALLAGVFVLGFVIPYVRLQRRRQQMLTQIPAFIDQVLRSLGTGRSVEGAIRAVVEETPIPLRDVLLPVIRATDLGASFTESLQDAAKLHAQHELGLVALAIRISNMYGTSAKDLLKSIMLMIRQREQAARELASMTGQTKVSAWVLSLIPISIVGYIHLMNPAYLDGMLKDPTGIYVFWSALGLQLTGIFVFWRMLKSV
ncbi:type II secretion system F family protein [Methylobacillus flagellatus]|uniref:type II secretion system F family protein n=1 Tax=Methylobacillus flagellatus TaxID=405 RepID=UPI0010F53E5A|nr:type II secretion system F family protein [Methylobacillus flagellatus]